MSRPTCLCTGAQPKRPCPTPEACHLPIDVVHPDPYDWQPYAVFAAVAVAVSFAAGLIVGIFQPTL